MSDIRDLLSSLFPSDTDEEINTKLQSATQDPEVTKALQTLLPSTDKQTEDESTPPKTDTSGNLTVDPNITSFQLPSANSDQSNFDVKESSSPITMNGATPTMPTGNVEQPNTALPAPIPEPVPTLPSAPTATPPAPQATSTGVKPAAAKPEENLLTTSTSSDEAGRQAMLADQEKKRKLGMIGEAIGGAGDAISQASTAFGAQAGTPVLDKIVEMESKNITANKAQFEENLKNDPSSDVSHSYQKVLGMMMGKPPTDPDIVKMSANTIAAQLPEVEKFMAKELGLKQIQATKQLAMAQQQGNERDRMWNQGVQTINQIRGDKPLVDSEVMRNGAISAYKAIDNIEKSGREPNQLEYYDLLGQLWKARTGSSVTNEELKAMDPKTLQSKLGPIGTFFTGNPKALATPGVTKAIKEFVVSSGNTADQIHDAYMQSRGVNAAASRMKSMYPEDADRLSKMARGLSFSEAVGQTNQGAGQITATNPKTGAKIKSTDGGQTWQPM